MVNSQFKYVIDEGIISQRMGHKVPPIRVFNLETFGINREQFLARFRPTFSVLHLDPYDAKRNKISFLIDLFPQLEKDLRDFLAAYYSDDEVELNDIRWILTKLSDTDRYKFDAIGMSGRRKRLNFWNFTRVPVDDFKQAVSPGDPRLLVRKFHETIEFVTDAREMRTLMNFMAEIVSELRPGVTKLEMHLHQMYIYADFVNEGDNAPEGMHQDGADYIVSALVVERVGITGGESVVLGLDKKTEYLKRTLSVGEGIFQADKNTLWHDISPIREDPRAENHFGHRSIFGLDINIIE
jgi:hypothetical protein